MAAEETSPHPHPSASAASGAPERSSGGANTGGNGNSREGGGGAEGGGGMLPPSTSPGRGGGGGSLLLRGSNHLSTSSRSGHSLRHSHHRRRSSAITVEHTAEDFAQLLELVHDFEEDDPNASVQSSSAGLNHEALAEFNARHDARWVDFGGLKFDIDEEENDAKGETGDGGGGGRGAAAERRRSSAASSVGSFETRNQRRASSLWRKGNAGVGGPRGSQRSSMGGFSFLEGLIEDDSDDDGDDDMGWYSEDDDDEEGDCAIQLEGGGDGRTKRRRKVRFGGPDRNEWRDTLSRADMTEEELVRSWYDEYDHEELQLDNVRTVNRVRRIRRRRAEAEAEAKEKEDATANHDSSGSNGGRDSASGDGGEDDDNNALCPRGLEHVIDESLAADREALRLAVAKAVFAAQGVTLAGGAPDVERIAKAAAALTTPSVELAIEAGEADAVAAERLRPKSRLSMAQLRLDVKRAQALSARNLRCDGEQER